MPLYEYRCSKCAKLIEVIQAFKDAPLKKCAACGGRLDKLISRSGFVLKGSGWYQSDYKAGPAAGTTDTSGSSAVADSTDKPAANSAAKPAAKTEGPGAESALDGSPGARESSSDKPARPAPKADRSGKAAGKGRRGR